MIAALSMKFTQILGIILVFFSQIALAKEEAVATPEKREFSSTDLKQLRLDAPSGWIRFTVSDQAYIYFGAPGDQPGQVADAAAILAELRRASRVFAEVAGRDPTGEIVVTRLTLHYDAIK